MSALAIALLAVSIAIPDRKQHAKSPPSGWCGETAIQEALLHFGVWASQQKIHDAGKSKHPDLYSDEIPTALKNLGVEFVSYAPNKKQSFSEFAWAAMDEGDPVLAGVKLLPTEHPTWGLDHFVLMVGYGPKGWLVNTTWGRSEWVSQKAVNGISFKNAFYGLRLRGPKSARLTVLEESDKLVKLLVVCPSKTRIETLAAESVARFACP